MRTQMIFVIMLGILMPVSVEQTFCPGALSGTLIARASEASSAGSDINRRQAAIDEARRTITRPLDGDSSIPADSRRPAAPERSAGGAARIFLILLLAVLVLASAFLFYKSRRSDSAGPEENDKASSGAAMNIRSVLNGQTGARDVRNIAINNPRFLELAVEHKLITQAERKSLSERFGDNAFAIMLFLAEQMPDKKSIIGKSWGDSIGTAYTDPTKTILQYELVKRLPKSFAEQNNVVPLYEMEGVVTVAMSDPKDAALQSRIEGHINALVSPVFALPDQIKAALEIAHISMRALMDQLTAKLGDAAHEGARIKRLAEEQTVAEFVRGLFLLSLKQRASDIHFEPRENDICIRMRIDGALQEYLNLPIQLFPSISNVVKIMAGADIGERRRPQDGRITMKLPDRELEFRFSCVPTIYGEKIVLRLLGQNQFLAVPGLEDLGFSSPILKGIRQIIESPNGVFFVTGPTGSGKTTTLYGVLKALNRKDLNIMTIEDPVEYRLAGVNQVQVNPQAGVTFATALRSFLRQDPDVILVGEIRDLETATIASQAALTGHLVLTTIHTNNALQAVTRLIQIGVEPFLVAPSIIGVMAQRLVRRLCDKCKEKYALSPEEIERYFDWDGKTEVFFYRGKGCEDCNFTGYSGRIAIHELFIIDEETRGYIARNASILDIQKYAFGIGFATMRYDGFKKILMGLTTPEEVNRATIASIN